MGSNELVAVAFSESDLAVLEGDTVNEGESMTVGVGVGGGVADLVTERVHVMVTVPLSLAVSKRVCVCLVLLSLSEGLFDFDFCAVGDAVSSLEPERVGGCEILPLPEYVKESVAVTVTDSDAVQVKEPVSERAGDMEPENVCSCVKVGPVPVMVVLRDWDCSNVRESL